MIRLLIVALVLLAATPAWAQFPSVTGTATTAGIATDATSHDMNIPSCASGDTLVVVVGARNAGAVGWPPSWTEMWDTPASTGVHAAAYKISNGAEGATINVTFGASNSPAGIAFCVGDASTVTAPADGTPSSNTSGSSTTPDPPSLTPGWTEDTLWFACFGTPFIAVVNAIPTDYSNNLFAAAGAGGTNRGSVSCARRALNAASENPGTFTLATGGVWIANTFAIRPTEAVGGGAPVILHQFRLRR